MNNQKSKNQLKNTWSSGLQKYNSLSQILFKDLDVAEIDSLFSDSCHFTDKGYEVMAHKINDLILLVRLIYTI